MSLIKIRGRTILSPILTEEERNEARAYREKAILYQRRLERQKDQHLQQCNYQYQQQQQSSSYQFHQQQQDNSNVYQPKTSGIGSATKGVTDDEGGLRRMSKGYNKNEIRQPMAATIKTRSCGETSSSSAPSSQGSGGELTSEGLEDSPSAANVSVQTESSGSITTSTDLHHYLNNSLDTSLDTSISVSHDIWHNSPSLIEVDEALLKSESTEVATSLILGRLHPSIILNSSRPRTSRQESQTTETTSSTLVQGHLSSGKHTISEGQDTATIGSVSLSFASVSEEGSEVLEVSEELLDISEEDKDYSFPSEIESDVHKFPTESREVEALPRTKIVTEFGTEEDHQKSKEKWKENVIAQQRDSGRGTSHSDYLDSYLDLLTNRSGSSHGLYSTTASVSMGENTPPGATTCSMAESSSSKVCESFSPKAYTDSSAVKASVKPRLVSSEENLEKICEASKLILQKDLLMRKSQEPPKPPVKFEEKINDKEEDSITEEMEEFDRIDAWQKELLSKPRASSATPERKERKRSRSRRWSSCQPLDPRRSVGSKYLDSYLGKLTDAAWLQYPTQLSERRMVYLSSDEYINAIRPKASQRAGDALTSTDMSENSASEENRNFHTSTESLQSSNTDGVIRDSVPDRSSGISLVEDSVAEQEDSIQTFTQYDNNLRSGRTGVILSQSDNTSTSDGDVLPVSDATSASDSSHLSSCQNKHLDDIETSSQPSSVDEASEIVQDTVKNSQILLHSPHNDMKSGNAPIYVTENQTDTVSAVVDDRILDDKEYIHDKVHGLGNETSCYVSQQWDGNKMDSQGRSLVNDRNKESQLSRLEQREMKVELQKPGGENEPKKEVKAYEMSVSTESFDDGQESYSDDSSETEPSTIVYLEDIPLESPSEGKTLLSAENEDQNYLRGEKSVSDLVGTYASATMMNGDRIPRNEAVVSMNQPDVVCNSFSDQSNQRKAAVTKILQPVDVVCNSFSDQSNLTNHSIKLITSQKMDKLKIGKPSTSDLVSLKMENGKQKMFESDMEESEEECLVVQVIVDDTGANESHKSFSDIAKLETKKKKEIVEKNLPREEVTTVGSIANSEMELAHKSPGDGWEPTPEQNPRDAVGQVLSLIKAKQEQELEELRLRQEAEIHQVLEKLQKVSPQQIHAFLSASTDNEVYIVPKSSDSDDHHSPDPRVSTSSCGEVHNQNERLEVKRNVNTLSPKKAVDLAKRRESTEEVSRTRPARIAMDIDTQSTVPCASYPSASQEKHPLTSLPSHADGNHGHIPTLSVENYPTYASNASYPTSMLPLTSGSSVVCEPAYGMSESCSSITRSPVESPKPRPSNHTNIMPSYFMYEETRLSSETQKDDNYRVQIGDQNSAFEACVTRPQNNASYMSSSLTNFDHNVIHCSAHVQNNNPETVDTMSYINGNCLSYGDGMQYYRLFTGDEDFRRSKSASPNPQVMSSSYPPQTTETVMQPGLFKIVGSSPRPTSITSLLKEHPEMFGEEVLEVKLEHGSGWTRAETEHREPQSHSREPHPHPNSLASDAYHQPPAVTTTTSSVAVERGLDMVPERESATASSPGLSENMIFVRGITRLQACVRRFMTQRLLRTQFVKEQLSILSEIAKLAQQFHRDILTDNIQKGDVDFHKTLYNQERLARDRIRRVFAALTVEEQMALIHRDRQLRHLEQERKCTGDPRVSPVHTRTKNKSQEERPKSNLPAKAPVKRPSPPGPRSQQERKSRVSLSSGNKTVSNTPLVQPTVIQQHLSSPYSRVSASRSEYRMSPRGSRLPVHVARSSASQESGHQPQHQRSSLRAARSPSTDSQSSLPSTTSRSSSQPPRSNSTSRLCGRTGSQSTSRLVTNTRSCTIRNATNRVTPPRNAAKTSLVGRKPWR